MDSNPELLGDAVDDLLLAFVERVRGLGVLTFLNLFFMAVSRALCKGPEDMKESVGLAGVPPGDLRVNRVVHIGRIFCLFDFLTSSSTTRLYRGRIFGR